jgi:hypothetical protein
MTHQELEEIFRGKADWRATKAEQYPGDHRNKNAAAMLQRLADTVADVPQTLLDAYEAAYRRWDDAYQIIDDMLREIGFTKIGWHSEPESAEAFVREFLDRAKWLNRRTPYTPTVV